MGAAGLASPQAPIAPTEIASLLLMDGVLEGMKDESGYKSLGKLKRDKIGCGRISCKIDKKEGGKSQLDVGGKDGHRLSPMHYTSIAEI